MLIKDPNVFIPLWYGLGDMNYEACKNMSLHFFTVMDQFHKHLSIHNPRAQAPQLYSLEKTYPAYIYLVFLSVSPFLS